MKGSLFQKITTTMPFVVVGGVVSTYMYWHNKRISMFKTNDNCMLTLLRECETIKPGEIKKIIDSTTIDEVDQEILSEMGCYYDSAEKTVTEWNIEKAKNAMFCYPNTKVVSITVCDGKRATMFKDCNCETTYFIKRKY